MVLATDDDAPRQMKKTPIVQFYSLLFEIARYAPASLSRYLMFFATQASTRDKALFRLSSELATLKRR